MPKELEDKLKKQAGEHKGWSDEKKDAYVYGTMRKTGWKPKREQHGSLEDITFHEEAATSEVIDDAFTHPVHKGYAYKGENTGLESGGAVTWGSLDPPVIDGTDVEPFENGHQSANRDAGQGVHYGAPVDYFGPDTTYRAEEIDPHQYGRDWEPIPFRDYYKTIDDQFERGFRVREQDKYDETATPGTVMDKNPLSEAYGAVNYQGAGPDTNSGKKAGDCDYRSFESQRHYARSNKVKSEEYAVDISGLDTKLGEDIK